MRSILIVEPNEAVREDVGRILARDGLRPSFVAGVADIARALGLVKPDLVLLPAGEKVNLALLEQAARRHNPRARVRQAASFGELLAGEGLAYEQVGRFLLDLTGTLLGLLDGQGWRGRAGADAARWCRLAAGKLRLGALETDTLELAAWLRQAAAIIARQRHGGEADEALRPAILRELLARLQPPYELGPLVAPVPGAAEPRGALVLRLVEEYLALRRQQVPEAEIAQRLRQAAGEGAGREAAEALLQAVAGEALLAGVDRPRRTVLVADPDAGFLTLLELRLGNEGCRVQAAANGVEALRLARAGAPDLVVAEVALPGLDGFSLLLELRKNPELRAVPVILVSARADTANMTRGLQLGAHDYLPKPVNLELLCTKARLAMDQAAAKASAPAAAPGGVSGDLAQLGFTELMNLLAVGSRSARLRLAGPGGRAAEFFVEQGRLVCARAGGKTGEEAFREAFDWSAGSFEILPAAPAPARELEVPLEALLLRVSADLDESRHRQEAGGAAADALDFLDEKPK